MNVTLPIISLFDCKTRGVLNVYIQFLDRKVKVESRFQPSRFHPNTVKKSGP